MSVSKQQIVSGVASYIQEAVLPKLSKNKGLQIGLSVAVNAVKANDALIDRVFDNDMIKAFLQDDGTGKYEIGPLMDSLKKSVEQYGDFPIAVPSIPLIAPDGGTITLNAADISAIQAKIEGLEAN